MFGLRNGNRGTEGIMCVKAKGQGKGGKPDRKGFVVYYKTKEECSFSMEEKTGLKF